MSGRIARQLLVSHRDVKVIFREITGKNPRTATERIVVDNATLLLASGLARTFIENWAERKPKGYEVPRTFSAELDEAAVQNARRFYRKTLGRDPETWDCGVVENIYYIRNLLGNEEAKAYTHRWDRVDGGKPCGPAHQEELLEILEDRAKARRIPTAH